MVAPPTDSHESHDSQKEQTLQALANMAITEGNDMVSGALSELPGRDVGRSYYMLGKLYYDKSDLLSAADFFERAAGLCELPGDVYNKFKILGFLVRIYSERQNTEKISGHIDESAQLLDTAQQSLGSLTSEYFYNAGILETYRGRFEQAKQNFTVSINKAKEENESSVLTKALYSGAMSCYQMQEYNESLEYLRQLEEILYIVKKTYINGAMNLLYGNLYTNMERYDKAMESFRRSHVSLQNKSCWNLQGYVLLSEGILLKKMGEFKRAAWVFDTALNTTNTHVFRRMGSLLKAEVTDLNDSNVDLYLDKTNRLVQEKTLGTIDFKHRFVLLEILFLLAGNPGRYYDKEQLARLVWKDEYNPLIHDKLIYTSVSRLRKLVEPKGTKRKYILRGKDGYTFNPLVKARFQRENQNRSERSLANVELISPV